LILDADLFDRNAITLGYLGNITIAGLSFDGGSTFAAPGTYGGIGSAATYQSDFFMYEDEEDNVIGPGLITVIPEPSSVLLVLMGVAGCLLFLRRRRGVPRQENRSDGAHRTASVS